MQHEQPFARPGTSSLPSRPRPRDPAMLRPQTTVGGSRSQPAVDMLAAGPARKLLVEAGSDADFRAVNARSAEAQAAPKNRYAQQYLETSGAPGDLRVSEVVSGDPVIVGYRFVHQRI